MDLNGFIAIGRVVNETAMTVGADYKLLKIKQS
jgi:hypothetical protein